MKFIGNIDTIRYMIESSRKDAYIEWDGNRSKVIGYIQNLKKNIILQNLK